MSQEKTVLFLCTGNSCRSQMAEGWLRHLSDESFEAISAGLEPRPVHPLAVQVMNEIGIDISAQRPKSIKEYLGKSKVDYAIFVCAKAERNCPSIYPFALNVLSWPFDDPAEARGTDEERLQEFRRIRDAIGRRTQRWLEGDETICHCKGVSKQAILAATDAGARTVRDIQRATGAGTGHQCTTRNPEGRHCTEDIERLLDTNSSDV